MAIQSVTLDPAATGLTPNEIVDGINAANNQITRDDSIDFDALDIVRTRRVVGDFIIKYLRRRSDGLIDIEYDDEAIS